ncbi:Eta tubulin [Volvox carteri f. nagariensis]|uniref:Eta tubulin n=1 Tax=Volvox carteri f. nagariensis TaxID=3068 RepID=D8TNP8_VOLCA|nr:Eta tubulin [Volvox carteri f. nagariensis]EFJ50878.1 Eta tubulin [Volvox carteri f. nagariensis]|eukprot:XP_002947890.1 Eta tubulin [Volvox carteri f. nagariensis]
MPIITLQVGQCGNQVGQVLFERLAAQSAATADRAADTEMFRWGPDGRRRARCLLVDTEPKVVNAVLAADREGLFSRQQCYMGQSGRGNNWAFGYNQLNVGSQTSGYSTATAAARPVSQPLEFRILDQLYDGIRREAEEADGCPNFLLIHSLAGGSGSGMGSRVLEHLRAQFPLSYIAAASVAPRAAGDTPVQSLNSVMALSFLQAYADMVLLFSNQDLMDACQRASVAALLPGGAPGGPGGAGSGLSDINRLVAHNLTGLLWPLHGSDALGGVGRIRDAVSTVAADPCTKLLETWTVHSHPNAAVSGMWADSLRSLGSIMPRADPLRSNAPITTSGAMLLARGYPAAAVPPSSTGGSAHSALLGAYVKSLGPHGAAPALLPEVNLVLRCGQPGATSPSLTILSNRSNVIGLLECTVQRALALCDAKAYLHWYARHGCSVEAVREAAHRLMDVAGCYRQVHRLPYDT